MKQQLEFSEKLVTVKSSDLQKSLLAAILGTKSRLFTVLGDKYVVFLNSLNMNRKSAVECAKQALALVLPIDQKRTCLATPVMTLTDAGVVLYTFDEYEEV